MGPRRALRGGILGTRAFYWWVTWSEDFRGGGRHINRWWVWCQLSDKRDRRRLKKAVDRSCEVLQRSPVAPGPALIVEQVLVSDENARASAYRRHRTKSGDMLQLHSARGKFSDAALEAWETLQGNLDGDWLPRSISGEVLSERSQRPRFASQLT